ncbi:uncharacterized protein MCYG_07689 [Microsporum canis CBS 113480]|uniref:Uncharacterized protein n=1 Tax=Arthroderma otae (strain ATCC MYA-4605 / CBS 113480) TaxID=554155 RepID=C5FX30_ARTOC|nr:uncharacterized protein MCYG_07689 [Microsporum canis CBS 113480]EEQ34870.1 predicted protein [Microsporum canis CBS 113480]
MPVCMEMPDGCLFSRGHGLDTGTEDGLAGKRRDVTHLGSLIYQVEGDGAERAAGIALLKLACLTLVGAADRPPRPSAAPEDETFSNALQTGCDTRAVINDTSGIWW